MTLKAFGKKFDQSTCMILTALMSDPLKPAERPVVIAAKKSTSVDPVKKQQQLHQNIWGASARLAQSVTENASAAVRRRRTG